MPEEIPATVRTQAHLAQLQAFGDAFAKFAEQVTKVTAALAAGAREFELRMDEVRRALVTNEDVHAGVAAYRQWTAEHRAELVDQADEDNGAQP